MYINCDLVGTWENPSKVGFKLCLSCVFGCDSTLPTKISHIADGKKKILFFTSQDVPESFQCFIAVAAL